MGRRERAVHTISIHTHYLHIFSSTSSSVLFRRQNDFGFCMVMISLFLPSFKLASAGRWLLIECIWTLITAKGFLNLFWLLCTTLLLIWAISPSIEFWLVDTVIPVSSLVCSVKRICVFTLTYPSARDSSLPDVIAYSFKRIEFDLYTVLWGKQSPVNGQSTSHRESVSEKETWLITLSNSLFHWAWPDGIF